MSNVCADYSDSSYQTNYNYNNYDPYAVQYGAQSQEVPAYQGYPAYNDRVYAPAAFEVR